MLSVKFVGENVKTAEYTVAENAEMDDIDENDKVDTVNLDVDQVDFVIHVGGSIDITKIQKALHISDSVDVTFAKVMKKLNQSTRRM